MYTLYSCNGYNLKKFIIKTFNVKAFIQKVIVLKYNIQKKKEIAGRTGPFENIFIYSYVQRKKKYIILYRMKI